MTFCCPAIAILGRIGQLLGVKAAFCAAWYDHCVFDPLGLHQPEDFGAEIIAPIRPSKAATRNRASTQMNAFNAAGIDENLAPRHRIGQIGHAARIDFKGERFLAAWGKGIAAQNGPNKRFVKAQEPVIIDRGNIGQSALNGRLCCLYRFSAACFALRLEIRVVMRTEQSDQRGSDIGRRTQGIDDRVNRETHAGLS